MRVRLTRWAYSPRTPRRIAHAGIELGLLVAAIVGVVLLASGIPGHVLASGVVDVAALLGSGR